MCQFQNEMQKKKKKKKKKSDILKLWLQQC